MLKENFLCAGIITFNPNILRLEENIKSIISNINKIIIVDNGSDNYDNIQNLCTHYEIEIIENEKNLGIATGLNQLLLYAKKNGFKYLLTLDQDSVVKSNVLNVNRKLFCIEEIAIITPQILDRNSDILQFSNDDVVIDVDWCITSGSVMNIDKCINVGPFDEKMFIDIVDFDYCYRVKKAGYRIVKNFAYCLLHELGEGFEEKKFPLHIIVSHHKPIRHYYFVRNCIYQIKKYKSDLFLRSMKMVMKEFVVVILYEREKFSKILFMLRGIYDGCIL
ncbi:MAG: glycosyltransferase [Butyrivibrio sp.]|nr:glycosyltransferase [Butyrivibrio sp.]